jgi:DNA topoisomerase-1
MYILLCKEGVILKQYYNDNFIEFNEFDTYKYLGLVYPYMCIFKDNIKKNEPALLMLSYDTKGRLQYKYNDIHIKMSQENKIKNIIILLNNFDKAMNIIYKDLKSNDLYIKVLSCMSLITYKTGIRIGKDIYFDKYNSIGLSTLQKKHLTFTNNNCKINFIGKKGVKHEYIIEDKKILTILQLLYNNTLNKDDFIFEININSKKYKITYIDFNEYVKFLFGNENITGKDFRTLLANIIFIDKILNNENNIELDKLIRISINSVAEELHNTKAVSKKSYIFDMIINYIKNNGIDKIKKLNSIDALKYICNNNINKL